MSNEEQSRLHAIIHGRVQGVSFRVFVVENGLTLGAKGWARNRWDGTVEVVAEGDRQMLERFLVLLRRGPRMANVTQVDLDWQVPTAEFNSFSMRSTF
jgi:acylphosphatase